MSFKVVMSKQNEKEKESIGWLARHRYRTLDKDEVIEKGDFYLDGRFLVRAKCVGQKAPDPSFTSHRQYIRLLKDESK